MSGALERLADRIVREVANLTEDDRVAFFRSSAWRNLRKLARRGDAPAEVVDSLKRLDPHVLDKEPRRIAPARSDAATDQDDDDSAQNEIDPYAQPTDAMVYAVVNDETVYDS